MKEALGCEIVYFVRACNVYAALLQKNKAGVWYRSHLSRERSEFRRLEKSRQDLLHEGILVRHSKHPAVGTPTHDVRHPRRARPVKHLMQSYGEGGVRVWQGDDRPL